MPILETRKLYKNPHRYIIIPIKNYQATKFGGESLKRFKSRKIPLKDFSIIHGLVDRAK